MARAKIKADLVELARAFLSSDGFKPEVIVTMPADVVYSFESAMEEVLVSTEGFNTFKAQWIATYRKFAREWAKNDLNRTWALALKSASDFVERENEAGNDGQDLFDQRYRAEFVAHYEQIKGIRRIGYGFDLAAAKEVEGLNKLITKLDTTPGNVNDGKAFPKVVDSKSKMTAADKAYDSNKNHHLLKRKRITSAIIVKKNRKSPRLRKHQVKPEIIAAQRERPKIERKFAELKRFHGLEEARYWGLAKVAIQFTMTAIACNLKRIVKLLFHQGCLRT
ncbi:MAG: Transposase IS4 family protein, partial [Candidatus Collierbacteria bacterium GW2011_GWA2_44_13]